MLIEYFSGITAGMGTLLLEFVASSGCVFFCANRLSRYADALEKKAIISAVAIGAFFLAMVTSIPEGVTTIGAAIMEGALDLGVANVFGSNTFNLAIVIVLDATQGRTPLLLGVQSRLVIVAAAGVIITTLAGMAIGVHQDAAAMAWEAWLGPAFSVALLAAYILLVRLVGQEHAIPETAVASEAEGATRVYSYTTLRIVTRLLLYAALLVAVSVWLLQVADRMAITPFELAGRQVVLGRTVVGTFLLSAATSFPELFVALTAMRLGQTNMAVASVLGSNLVNMLFLPLMHVAVRDTVFYSRMDAPSVLILVCMTVLMTVMLILGLVVRSRRAFLTLGWETLGMLAVYLAGAVLVLRMGLQL